MNLYVAIDISGSMLEEGKQLIARELLRTIRQYIYYKKLSVKIDYLTVGNHVNKVLWEDDSIYPEEFFNIEKELNIRSLIEYFKDTDLSDSIIFVITDGFFSNKDEQIIRKWENQQKDKICFIKINSSSSSSLNKYSVYEVEDIFKAIDENIKNLATQQQEVDEDDW